MKPHLRKTVPSTLADIPENTAWEAGYLVTKNAGWRSIRPIIDPKKCVGCQLCKLVCPTGSITAGTRVEKRA